MKNIITFIKIDSMIMKNLLKVLHFNMEGNVNFTALLFIPSHAPYDFYSKEYEKV